MVMWRSSEVISLSKYEVGRKWLHFKITRVINLQTCFNLEIFSTVLWEYFISFSNLLFLIAYLFYPILFICIFLLDLYSSLNAFTADAYANLQKLHKHVTIFPIRVIFADMNSLMLTCCRLPSTQWQDVSGELMCWIMNIGPSGSWMLRLMIVGSLKNVRVVHW